MKRTSRKPSHVSESLQRHLNAYAIAAGAAGVGLLALARPAEAKIVYYRAHQLIVANRNYGLDLNHDGIVDFRFRNVWSTRSGRLSLNVPLVGNDKGVWATFSSGSRASALPSGTRVGFTAPFAYKSRVRMASAGTQGSTSGLWCGAKNRYLGLKFPIRNATHFGWARLSVNCATLGVSATLTGYAYETIPGKAIITGKTHGPDVITLQDASLGHLARGASGLSAWRQSK